METNRTIAQRYELTSRIGRGAMGEVWQGFDRRLDRRIAVKLLAWRSLAAGTQADRLTKRFIRETRITARVEHPGVPAVYDSGQDGDDLYLVMQLISGRTLSAFIRERAPVSTAAAVSVAAQIAGVLAAAHARSLVHRDLKPNNVMIGPDGGVKLLDFGIAALLDPTVSRLTAVNESLGTPAYMAPEQINGESTSPRGDLYALGCVLYELLVGHPPFRTEKAAAMMYQHLYTAPRPVRDTRPRVPVRVERLVLELLAKRPDERPETAEDVFERLEPFLPAPGSGSEHGHPDPTRPYRRPLAPMRREEPLATVTRLATAAPSSAAERSSTGGRGVEEIVDEVDGLMRDQRFTQAIDLLSEVLESFGGMGRMARIRYGRLLADARFLSGDARAALPEYEALLPEITAAYGAHSDEVCDCRQRIAECRIELGDPRAAIDTLNRAYHDRYERTGETEERGALALRHRIGRILSATNDHAAAEAWMRRLLDDMVAPLGHLDPLTAEVMEEWMRLRKLLKDGQG